MSRRCRICDVRVKTGAKRARERWNKTPVCRDCDNYILENFNYNGNHLSAYISNNEYVKGINISMSLLN